MIMPSFVPTFEKARAAAIDKQPSLKIRFGTGASGLERIEADISGQPFSVHRRDVYTLSMPLSGSAGLHYRGNGFRCLPGELCIFHPDEPRSFESAMAENLIYRAAYVDPSLIRNAIHENPLPFVATPVNCRPDLLLELISCFRNMDEPLHEMQVVEMVVCIARILEGLAGLGPRKRDIPAMPEMWRVRDAIMAVPENRLPVEDLENIANLDRWTLARQFRAAFGTSPSRFRTMRQLDKVRTLIRKGVLFPEASFAAGFADQSHMTRKFKNAYGITPGQWASFCRQGITAR